MDAPTQLPTWADKTLKDAGELVGDPADTKRTRSQFFGDPQALDTNKNFFPYISICHLVQIQIHTLRLQTPSPSPSLKRNFQN
jgi:hypothetical protein